MKNRQQILTVLALAMVGLWAGNRFVFEPLLAHWRERNVRIGELRKSITHGAQLVARESTIRERWESMRTNALPQEVSAAEGRVISAINQWSEASTVSINSIKPQWKRTDDEYAALECRVDGFGSLVTITRFLHALEKDPLALKVESVELTANNNEGSQLTLGLTVSGLQLSPAQAP